MTINSFYLIIKKKRLFQNHALALAIPIKTTYEVLCIGKRYTTVRSENKPSNVQANTCPAQQCSQLIIYCYTVNKNLVQKLTHVKKSLIKR